MKKNNVLRIHMINVGHGDSILVEFPDIKGSSSRPRFGLVDAGGEDAEVRTKTLEYLQNFLTYRLESSPFQDPNAFEFEFICLTHPHYDHYSGMMPVLDFFFSNEVDSTLRPKQFWDCGFRYNTISYLSILEFLKNHAEDIQFVRVTSGTEFHFGETEVVAIAPSIDLRNRYDTYGVNVNDASIVLRITLSRGIVILAGDAQFDSWGKICEEYPRIKHLIYNPDARGNADLRDPNHADIAFLNQDNQLNCQLLKVSHHGSKNGTSYEYIVKLSPSHFAISCDSDSEYQTSWRYKFPHPISRLIIGEETKSFNASSSQIPDLDSLSSKTGSTAELGTIIYSINRGGAVKRITLADGKHERVSVADFENHL